MSTINLTVLNKELAFKTCRFCGGMLGDIEHYTHSGGWVVEGFEERQWLYKTCLKCGHQWKLSNLGILR